MEHILFSLITVGSKELAIGRVCFDDTLINSIQLRTSIGIWIYGDREISLGSMKSGTEMRRIGFGRNSNDGIGVNPPRTTGSQRP